MRDKIKLATILLLTGMLTWNIDWATAQEPEAEEITTGSLVLGGSIQTIKSIDFVYNETFKDKTLRKQLDFKVGDNLDPVLVGAGRIEVSEYYRKKGFADIQVTVDTSAFSDGLVIYIIDEGERQQIKSIKFAGNEEITTGELRSVIKMSTNNWFFWPFYYTEEKLDIDLQRLKNLYYERGFLNHQINSEGRSNIIFLIEEGPRYDVNDIVITGNTYFNDETLLEGIKLERGQTYYPLKANAHAIKIRNLYRENGFLEAQIEQRHSFTRDGINKVDVEYRIIEGSQYRIGLIDIIGNEQTQDRVIRNVLEEYDFSPGKLYNADIAPPLGGGDLENRIRSRTLADEVIVTPVIPAENAEDTRDARVSIKEGLTGSWNAGVAYGSDGGLVGSFMWSQRNFDITDRPRSFTDFFSRQTFKGAGQSLAISLQPGREESNYSIEFIEPYFQNRPVSLSLGGSGYERWLESHNQQRTRGYIGFAKRYKNLWYTSFRLRVENVEIKSLDYDAPQEIIDIKGHNLVIGTRFGIGKEDTDDFVMPSTGYKFDITYEQVTGEDDFGILEGSGVLYKTLYEDILERKTVLATKVLAATTLSDAPPFAKFYGGGIGIYGIRGFEYRGISPRGLQTNVVNPLRIDPIGSDWIFLANTELSVPVLSDNFSLLFFMDSGTIETGPYRSSVGAGIQIAIPQVLGYMPMRFTFAEPLKKDDEDETQFFNFFMGGMF